MVRTRQETPYMLEMIEEFVKESLAVSGIEWDPESPAIRSHLDIATILARRPFNFLSPEVVHYALTGATGKVLRTNTEFTQLGKVPPGSLVKQYLSDWMKEAESLLGCAKAGHLTEAAIVDACWNLHHKLVCILPFKEASSRTARLMLLHLRVHLGFPILVIRNAEAGEYYKRIAVYQKQTFLPALRAEARRRRQRSKPRTRSA